MTVPLTEPSDRRRRRTHAAVLDAASTLFAERGFRRTSVDELAQTADVALSSIYANFPGGKADVYAALACRVAREHADAMRAALAGGGSPAELLVFDEYVRFHSAHPVAFRVLGLSDIDRDDTPLFDEARDFVHGVLQDLVEAAVAASGAPAAQARREVLRIWAAINGLLGLRVRGFVSAAELDGLLAELRAETSARAASTR